MADDHCGASVCLREMGEAIWVTFLPTCESRCMGDTAVSVGYSGQPLTPTWEAGRSKCSSVRKLRELELLGYTQEPVCNLHHDCGPNTQALASSSSWAGWLSALENHLVCFLSLYFPM